MQYSLLPFKLYILTSESVAIIYIYVLSLTYTYTYLNDYWKQAVSVCGVILYPQRLVQSPEKMREKNSWTM